MSQEIITKEQGVLIDRSKAYLDASEQSVKHFKAYAFLAGRTLHALKEITPHGQFETLRNKFLPDRAPSTIKNYMGFAEAVASKKPTIGFLTDDRLLSDRALTEAEKDKVVEAVGKVTGEKGLVEVIREHQKKKNKKPAHEPTPDEIVQAELDQANGLADAVLDAIAVLLTSDALAKVSPAKRENLLGQGIRLNDAIRAIKPAKKK